MERIILEGLGLGVVGGGAFLLTNVFALAPLMQDWSKDWNTGLFCLLPLGVYAAFRIYFGVLFHATSSLSAKRPQVVRVMTLLAVVGGVYAMMKVVPNSEESIKQLYTEVVGDLPEVVLKAGDSQIKNAQKMSYRVFGLLGGWFLVLFVVELGMRAVLWVLSLLLAPVLKGKGKGKRGGEQEAEAEKEPSASDE